MSYAENTETNDLLYKHAFVIKKNPQWRMRRSPDYIETPQIRLPPAVNISHQNIRGVHSEHTQNFIYPSLKCKWPIHTKLLAPNDLIPLSYRTQDCVRNDNVYYELKKKIDWNILVLPDQCSRTFWAFSRYRYRDTIRLQQSRLLYPRFYEVERGGGGILVSPCPSVRLSVRGQNHVSSVSSTMHLVNQLQKVCCIYIFFRFQNFNLCLFL